MKHTRYIASCKFSLLHPELSLRIQRYLAERFGVETMRCCVRSYKVRQYEEAMPEEISAGWKATPHWLTSDEGDTIISICHNCTAIYQEQHPEVRVVSLWEWMLKDDTFAWPDYKGACMTMQDCWRQADNRAEQDAVRELARRMNIEVVELADNREKTHFCGYTVLQPSVRRNEILAPKRFVENAKGMFVPHTVDEQKKILSEYAKQYTTNTVLTYCHYCSQGLDLVGKPNKHIAELLFGDKVF